LLFFTPKDYEETQEKRTGFLCHSSFVIRHFGWTRQEFEVLRYQFGTLKTGRGQPADAQATNWI
jgi:hypothetical protein